MRLKQTDIDRNGGYAMFEIGRYKQNEMLATVEEGDPKAPFSVATTPRFFVSFNKYKIDLNEIQKTQQNTWPGEGLMFSLKKTKRLM